MPAAQQHLSLDSGSTSSLNSRKETLVTYLLASFAQPCVLCGAKADHTIVACDARASRRPEIRTAEKAPALRTDLEVGPCDKCDGTGIYVAAGDTRCYRCAGKGHLTDADVRRNHGYAAYHEKLARDAEKYYNPDGLPSDLVGVPTEALEEAASRQCFGRSCGECGNCMDGYDSERFEAEWPSFDQQVDIYYARLSRSDA